MKTTHTEVATLAAITTESPELLVLIQDAEALVAAFLGDHGQIDFGACQHIYEKKARDFVTQARSVLAENDLDPLAHPAWEDE